MWRYSKPASHDDVSTLEKSWGITLPSDYVQCVIKNNGGRPSKSDVNTSSGTRRVFNNLISVRANDQVNVYKVREAIVRERKLTDLYPFGSGPFGGEFCFKAKNGNVVAVVFRDDDTGEEHVCNSFAELLSLLG